MMAQNLQPKAPASQSSNRLAIDDERWINEFILCKTLVDKVRDNKDEQRNGAVITFAGNLFAP